MKQQQTICSSLLHPDLQQSVLLIRTYSVYASLTRTRVLQQLSTLAVSYTHLDVYKRQLMHRGLSILRGCPRISDVFCMEEILKSLGAVIWWDDHDLYLDVPAQTEQTFLQSIQAECVLQSFWQVRCLQETGNAG